MPTTDTRAQFQDQLGRMIASAGGRVLRQLEEAKPHETVIVFTRNSEPIIAAFADQDSGENFAMNAGQAYSVGGDLEANFITNPNAAALKRPSPSELDQDVIDGLQVALDEVRGFLQSAPEALRWMDGDMTRVGIPGDFTERCGAAANAGLLTVQGSELRFTDAGVQAIDALLENKSLELR